MKKITIFYDADFATMEGGGQKRLFEISKAANNIDKNNQVNWISFKFWDSGSSFKKDGITYKGVISKPNFYNINGDRNIYEPLLYFLNCLLSIPKFVKSDIFIVGQWPLIHIFPIIIIGLILRKEIYIEWWETLHNQWIKKGFPGRVAGIIEKLLIYTSSYTTFVVECDSEKKLIKDTNKNAKVIIIENGVDIEKYSKSKISKKYDFISLGRLVKHKNVDVIIKAVHRIKTTYGQNVSMCIVGDGPEKETIQDLIKSLNLESNVTAKGFVSDEREKNLFIQESKIGVIAQKGVGRGNLVVNELMSGGIPVIAVGGENGIDSSYITEGIDGYLVESLDYNHLAESMNKMLVNKEKLEEMSEYLKSNIENFSWSSKLKNYPALLNNKI
tara:strand:+ start:551 stop:1708 length:1158 start_codon:yes stop_codon:yes gene_type:complete